jgi:hypothetical protein
MQTISSHHDKRTVSTLTHLQQRNFQVIVRQ